MTEVRTLSPIALALVVPQLKFAVYATVSLARAVGFGLEPTALYAGTRQTGIRALVKLYPTPR